MERVRVVVGCARAKPILRASGPLALVLLLAGAAGGQPDARRPPPPAESFTFDIKFLWFDRAAVGALELRRLEGGRGYLARLRAQTRGFVGFLTRRQQNIYESRMLWSPSEGKFISQRFRKEVRIGEDSWTSDTRLDYGSRQMHWTTGRNGRAVDRGQEPIPPGIIYEDILSAFFNLRNGVYGPIREGRFIRLQTLPIRERDPRGEEVLGSEFISTFEIQVADRGVEGRYRKVFHREAERGYLVLVKIPPEIFGQKTGEVRIWLDPSLLPLEATVEDAVFYGDVTGTLRGHARPMPPLDREPEGVFD